MGTAVQTSTSEKGPIMKRTITIELVGDETSTDVWVKYLIGECEYRLQNDDPFDDGTAGVVDDTPEVAYDIKVTP